MTLRQFTIRLMTALGGLITVTIGTLGYAIAAPTVPSVFATIALILVSLVCIPLAARAVRRRSREAEAARRLKVQQASSHEEPERSIRLVLAVAMKELSPDDDVAHARAVLVKQFERVPSIDELAHLHGTSRIEAAARNFVEERMRAIESDARCHLCGNTRSTDGASYEFGLARDHKVSRDWGSTILAAVVMNAIALPFGYAVGGRPGQRTTAEILRCRLKLCDRCAEMHRGVVGKLSVSEGDCRQHPGWNWYSSEGFTKFLPPEALTKFRPVDDPE